MFFQLADNVQYKKRRAGDKHYISDWYLAKYNILLLSFLLKMSNFIFGDFINKHKPLGKPKLLYVFYTLLGAVFILFKPIHSCSISFIKSALSNFTEPFGKTLSFSKKLDFTSSTSKSDTFQL